MPIEESKSTEAVRLTRNLFEFIHGNLGLLNFNIEELTPTNGTNGENSLKWHVVCSFFESLGSTAPSKYTADVNLNDKTVTIKKISGPGMQPVEPEQHYHFTEKSKEASDDEAK